VNVNLTPIGDVVLPDDLGAPFGGCCDVEWWATIEEVANAAAGVRPLVSPCCGRRYLPRDLSLISFFSRADWDDADEDGPPEPYRIGSAFTFPVARGAA
jgi:hypothetical protein